MMFLQNCIHICVPVNQTVNEAQIVQPSTLSYNINVYILYIYNVYILYYLSGISNVQMKNDAITKHCNKHVNPDK